MTRTTTTTTTTIHCLQYVKVRKTLSCVVQQIVFRLSVNVAVDIKAMNVMSANATMTMKIARLLRQLARLLRQLARLRMDRVCRALAWIKCVDVGGTDVSNC
jgi:hypothetical protein